MEAVDKMQLKRTRWEIDNLASNGYNILAKFESTLINFGIMLDYSNITDTEEFDKKHYKTVLKRDYRHEFLRIYNYIEYSNLTAERTDGDADGAND